MKKLILLLVILAAASATVPALRERVEPRVGPVWDYGIRRTGSVLRKGLDPLHRWYVHQELRGIARELRERELSHQPLPSPGQFGQFMAREHVGGHSGFDPWGVPYFMVLRRDSILIGSAGPDKRRGTGDDLYAGVPRR